MANTSILIKRSSSTGRPSSLKAGELAYSYQSNTLFFGTADGTGAFNIGGQFYTSTVDSATAANVASTLVKRDENNGFFGALYGNANSATKLLTSRNFDISGGDITASAVGFDGTAAVTLNASLNTVSGLSAGVYGGASVVPIVTVAANGRIMAIANSTTISTALGIAGDSGTDTVNLASDTLTVAGGAGLTSAVTDNTITINVDNTVVRANTASLNQTIDGNLTVSGNLNVLGTETIVNVSTFEVTDPLIYLAGGNYVSDAVDIGFVGNYNNGSANLHAGLIRHAGDKDFYIFDSYNVEPDSNVIDISGNGFHVANLHANILATAITTSTLEVSTVAKIAELQLTTDLAVSQGGTGASSFTNGAILIGSGTGALSTLANSTYTATGSGASNSTVSSLTVDDYGRVTAATFSSISGLTVSQGGTGQSSFTAGQLVIGDGTSGLKQIANAGYTLTGTLGAAKTITSLTVDDYGRVTAATAADISGLTVSQGGTGASSLSAGQMLVGNGTGAIQTVANVTYTLTGTLGAAKTITSLTVDAYGRVSAATASDISGLTVAQGGTGASTFTTNGIVYGSGTSAMGVTAAAGTSDQTWSNQILTTTNAGVPVWTTTLDGGQF